MCIILSLAPSVGAEPASDMQAPTVAKPFGNQLLCTPLAHYVPITL